MGRRVRLIGWTMLAAFHVGAWSATAQMARPVELSVEMRDLARVPAEVMGDAKAEIDRTFHAAGIQIVWVEPGRSSHADPAMLRVFIVRSSMPGVRRRNEPGQATLGFAPTCGNWAQVFYDRVSAAVARGQTPTGVVLANVIAHELGHLLLPPRSHAVFGAMRESVALQGPARRRFSNEQARLIRAALLDGTRRHECGRPEGNRLAMGNR